MLLRALKVPTCCRKRTPCSCWPWYSLLPPHSLTPMCHVDHLHVARFVDGLPERYEALVLVWNNVRTPAALNSASTARQECPYTFPVEPWAARSRAWALELQGKPLRIVRLPRQFRSQQCNKIAPRQCAGVTSLRTCRLLDCFRSRHRPPLAQ